MRYDMLYTMYYIITAHCILYTMYYNIITYFIMEKQDLPHVRSSEGLFLKAGSSTPNPELREAMP